ncbi:MAG: Hsp20 family protein [Spirochaetes bacterium]|nr:Hsp20 family protein [Spirochaetota bacterium]MBU1080096.1 Hsp20 family protein [Spirochaetota bacterium]
MSRFNEFGESFESIIRELSSGAEEFARAMAAEAESKGYGDFCGGKKFNMHFDNPLYPRHDSYEAADGSLVYRFLLPGFDESCISLTFKGDTMVLKATLPERLRAEAAAGRKPFLRDVDRREYRVPAERYDQPAAKAAFRDGILTVTIPAKEEDMSQSIKVEIVKEGN